MNDILDASFDWQCHPQTDRFIHDLVRSMTVANATIADLEMRLRDETGTRLIDWIDHLHLPADDPAVEQLATFGYQAATNGNGGCWNHHGGMFPTIRIAPDQRRGMALKVESVTDFVFAHQRNVDIQGTPGGPLRIAMIDDSQTAALWVAERHGRTGMTAIDVSPHQVAAAMVHRESFLHRRRDFDDDAAGFAHAGDLVRRASEDLDIDWVCDLFFAAERRYWESRNRAAQLQKRRQDRLGMGWANHDHHTYRSSRECFADLIGLLEQLGFECRERFYGGSESGWGAQVLQQPATGVVIFADVDLSPAEVTGDFAHQGLQPNPALGTVGLWCKLHGEAMLAAGMHHLECQFDFDAARQQLMDQGIGTMKPFTDFEFLKQAFTEPETWPVVPSRIDAAVAAGWITPQQAEKFRHAGSIGSHLEILQRDQGYKGFNQTGISEIIRQTDPRRRSDQGAATAEP